jgi:hypothetical protein
MVTLRTAFFLLMAFSVAHAGACVPIDQAKDKLGRTTCVTGKVLKVAQTQNGTWFLDFCENYRECPFTVVVFRKNLRDVGDISRLEGEQVEVHGKIREYDGRAEITLEDVRQLKGAFPKLPPLPKNFDAEKRGNFSPGDKPKHSSTRSTPKRSKRKNGSPRELEEDD